MIEAEFTKIYEEYADAIFKYCFFRANCNRELAKDLMQETFTKTWNYLARGKTIDNNKAFLYKVATNLIINFSQKKKDVSLDMLREEGFEPGFDDRESLDNFIAGKKALEMLDNLDPKYSEVILMRYIQDLLPKEIAEILGENSNVVSVRINRALKKLKELIE